MNPTKAPTVLGTRKLVLWVPDWHLAALAAVVPPHLPAVTLRHGRIESTTRLARDIGLRRGMSLLAAQQICSDVVVLPHDPQRADSAFEVLLQLFDQLTPGVCALRPGLAWAQLGEGNSWTANEEDLMTTLIESVATTTGIEAYVGVANGAAAATAAARRGLLLSRTATLNFLSTLPVSELWEFLPTEQQNEYQPVGQLLQALGIRSVAQLWNLGEKQLLARFGKTGHDLWRLSKGGDLYVSTHARIQQQVQAQVVLDPPAIEVAQALVPARRVAHELTDSLQRHGWSSPAIQITLVGTDGQEQQRQWGLFDTSNGAQVSQRVIWQLRSWQDQRHGGCQLGAIRLATVGVVAPPRAAPLWGGTPHSRHVDQAVAQVQLLAGEDSVLQPHLQGGASPRKRIRVEPWGKELQLQSREGEWAGSVKDAPLVLFTEPPAAKLMGLSGDGTLGVISGNPRGLLTGVPQRLVVLASHPELPAGGYTLSEVKGIWTIRNEWWNTSRAQYRLQTYVRVKIEGITSDLLLVQDAAQWLVEGIYAELLELEAP